jgi:hypothetical protein
MRLLSDESGPSDAGGDGGEGSFSAWRCDCDDFGQAHAHFKPELGGRCSVQGCPCEYRDVAVGIALDGTPVTVRGGGQP